MYERWFRYGDVEVVNNVRVQQYVENGLKPTGAFIPACDDCGDLPTVVDGVSDYQTPELDFAPWVLGSDADAGDFAGVMVKEVTGLDGSTVQVDVEEKVGDGGAIGTRRASSRTVAVTADVVARTREAASIGLEWLAAALHPPCSPGGDCAGGVLHMFTACPVACVGQTDPDSAFETVSHSDPAVFQTSGLKSTNANIDNYALNPSAEDATMTSWHSNSIFGAYITGTVTKVAPPSVLSRPNAARLDTPALAIGQQTNVVADFNVPVAGTYEFSCWVYVPAATTIAVQAIRAFGGGGPFTAVKDRWVRLSYTETLGAGNYFVGVGTEAVAAAKAANMFIYMDGAVLRPLGGLPPSASFQGVNSTDVEGWHTNSVFGNFTPAAAIATDAFAGPDGAPRSLKITWGFPNTGTTGNGYAAVDPAGLALGQVYTYEGDIYVPSGSASVKTDVIFNGNGATITTKNAWVHFRHTFVYDGFGTFNIQGLAPSGAGQVCRVANLRLLPGFGTMQTLTYFDGTVADDTTSSLAVSTTVPAGGTITPGVIGPDGATWSRFTASGSNPLRSTVTGGAAKTGRHYHASWLLCNNSASPVTVKVDVNDVVQVEHVLAPGEIRRVFSQGVAGAANYFAADLVVPASPGTVLYRDVRVEAVAPYDYSWTGAAETTSSAATVLGDDFIFKPNAGDSALYGPVQEGVCDDVTVAWVVSSPTGVVFDVQVGWATEGGQVLLLGPRTALGSTPIEIRASEQSSPGFPDNWRPALIAYNWSPSGSLGQQVTVHSLDITHRPVLTVEECVKPYRRTLHNVVTVDGPKVLEWLTLGDETDGSTVARVEWTWVATDPHVWHDPIPLLTTVQGKGSGAPTYQAPGVPLSAASTVGVAATACARPALTALTCADNALGPGIVLPPQAPLLADSSIMVLTGTNRTRRAFEIPTDISPIGLGKLSWKFVNDNKPKFGIRVRIYNDTIAGFLPETECSFIEEFTVEYLAADQTLFIDGPGDDAYVLCGVDINGDPIYAPALKNLRGNYGGPFKNSWIGCGGPYYITVDIPDTYTVVPSNLSGLGAVAQGDVQWSVDLVRRG